MSTNEIAKSLLDMREKRITSFIMSGELREALGFEGYGEALRRRWITPDETGSGMVTVTNHLDKIQELRNLAQETICSGCKDEKCTCKCKDGKCTCKCKEEMEESIQETAHHLATSHAFRKHSLPEYATMGLGRTGDAPETPVPGLGNAHSAPTAMTQPAVTAAGANPPAVHAPAAGAAAAPGSVAANMVQAEALAQSKFGMPFAQLTPDQQTQVQSEMKSTTAPAQ